MESVQHGEGSVKPSELAGTSGQSPIPPLNSDRSLVIFSSISIWQAVLDRADELLQRDREQRVYGELMYKHRDWSLGAVLSLLIWKDRGLLGRIGEGSNGFHEWRSAWSQQVRYGSEGTNAVDAFRFLLDALKRGDVGSIEQYERQSREHWYGVPSDTHGAQIAFGRNPRFDRDEILAWYGAVVSPPDSNPAPDRGDRERRCMESAKAYIQRETRAGRRPTKAGFIKEVGDTFPQHLARKCIAEVGITLGQSFKQGPRSNPSAQSVKN
jgi:hypothetical protein